MPPPAKRPRGAVLWAVATRAAADGARRIDDVRLQALCDARFGAARPAAGPCAADRIAAVHARVRARAECAVADGAA